MTLPITIIKTTLHYKGFWNCDARCGLEILENGDKYIVILTELPDNPGTSVTNMYEHLATYVYHRFLSHIPVDRVRWIEHYEATVNPATRELEETWDEVTLQFDEKVKVFYSPKWRRIKKEDIFKEDGHAGRPD